MLKLRRLLIFAFIIAGFSARAGLVDGVIVKSGDTTKEFAITEIKEITFSDTEMTVVKADEATFSFSSDWQITFGKVDMSGISAVDASATDAPAKVYTIDGRMVGEYSSLSAIRVGTLPSGIYIVESNGKSFKIQR